MSFAYDMKVLNNGTANFGGGPQSEAGELPGFSFFYSLTGGSSAAEWIAVPALATSSTVVGSVTSVATTLNFASPLANGSTMYFRWADDNSVATGPDQNFAIDNVAVQRIDNAPTLAAIEAAPLAYVENAAATAISGTLTRRRCRQPEPGQRHGRDLGELRQRRGQPASSRTRTASPAAGMPRPAC